VPRFIVTVLSEGYEFAAKLNENPPPAQPAIDAPTEEAPPPSTERRQLTRPT